MLLFDIRAFAQKCKMQNAKCKMQNAKCKMQNALAFLFFYFQIFSAFGQSDFQHIRQKLDLSFSQIDKSQIPTGYLHQ